MKSLKVFAVFAAMFAAVSLFAEKPEQVAVISYSNDNSAETRVGSLVLEYFKAELSTMSGIKVIAPTKLIEAQKKVQISGNPDAAQVKAFCDATDSHFFCLLTVTNQGESKFELNIFIYDVAGKQIGKISKKFGAVKETDFVSVTAAKETAQIIRGQKAVDSIHSAREQRLEIEIKNSKPLR